MFLKRFPRYAGRARRGATVAGDHLRGTVLREAATAAVIVYRSGLTKGTGVLSGARRIDVTMSITRILL